MSALEVDIRKRLESVGLERTAFDWVLKACHPAGATSSPGLPDMSTASVFRPEFRDTCVVSCPPAIVGSWDLLAWRPPGDGVALIYATGPSGTTDFSSGNFAASSQGVCLMQPSDTQAYNMVNTLAAVQAWSVATLTSRPLAWRYQYSSITAYMTASALSDQGTLYVSTFDRPVTNKSYARWPVNLAGLPTTYQFNQFVFPFDENRLMLTDPRTVVTPAKDGAYVPIRLCGPSQPFVSANAEKYGSVIFQNPIIANPNLFSYGAGPLFPDTAFPSPMCGRYPFNLADTSSFGGLLGSPGWQGNIPVNSQWCIDSGYDNVNHVVMIFRGLANSASITFKLVSGLEVIPRLDSPVLQFTQKPVRFSPNALSFYQAVAEEMRTVYPSSFNSFGTILSAIGSAASRIWPVVRGIGSALVPVLDKALGAPEALSDRQVVTTTSQPAPMGSSTVQTAMRKTLRKKKPGRRVAVVTPRGSRSRSRSRSVLRR